MFVSHGLKAVKLWRARRDWAHGVDVSPTDKLAHVQQLLKRSQGEQKMIFCLSNNLVALPVRRGINV